MTLALKTQDFTYKLLYSMCLGENGCKPGSRKERDVQFGYTLVCLAAHLSDLEPHLALGGGHGNRPLALSRPAGAIRRVLMFSLPGKASTHVFSYHKIKSDDHDYPNAR